MFSYTSDLQNTFDLYTQYGKHYAKTQTVGVLSIVRNLGIKYQTNLPVIKNLLSMFAEGSMVQIYENDSIDDTADNIKQYLEKTGYEQFSIYSETLDTPYLPLSKSLTRTYNLAKARNQCYNLAKKKNIDFWLVIDLDFVDMSLEGIMNSMGWLSKHNNISAICGNSLIDIEIPNGKIVRNNYDSFAFRLNSWSPKPCVWFANFYLEQGSQPIHVYSGFGGCAIYRNQFYSDMYSGEDCEHVMLHSKMYDKFTDFRLFYNPSQQMLVD